MSQRIFFDFKYIKVSNVFATTPLYHFKIVSFKDLTHKTSKKRYWLTFRTEDNECCLLTTFTSKDTLAMLYKNDDNALDSLLYIKPNEFNPPFTIPTYLDCNIQDMKHRITFQELINKHIDWQIEPKVENYTIPQDIENDIIKKIVNSNFTSPEIKNGFIKTYPNLFN